MNGIEEVSKRKEAEPTLSVLDYIRLILRTPVAKGRDRKGRRVGWDRRIRVARWVKEDFPDLAGAELPPPLDYFYDAVAPNTTRLWDLFSGRLSRRGKWIGWIRLTASWMLVGVVLYVIKDYNMLWPLLYLLIFGIMFGLRRATYVHRPTVPVEIWFARDPMSVQELAVTPLTGRDLFLGQVVRALRARRLVWVGVLMSIGFATIFFLFYIRIPVPNPGSLVAYLFMMSGLVYFFSRYGDGLVLLTVCVSLISPLDRVVFRKTWSREHRRERRRFRFASFVLSIPVGVLLFVVAGEVIFLPLASARLTPLFLVEVPVLVLLAHSPLVWLGQKTLRARVRMAIRDVDGFYRGLRERQLKDIEEGRPVTGLRGLNRWALNQ